MTAATKILTAILTGLVWAILGALFVAVVFAVSLLSAQVIVFGLSLFHVDSGIWGPWLLMDAAIGVVSLGATIGHNS